MIIYSFIVFLFSPSFYASASDCHHPSVALADIFRPAHPQLYPVLDSNDLFTPYDQVTDSQKVSPAFIQDHELWNDDSSLLFGPEHERFNLHLEEPTVKNVEEALFEAGSQPSPLWLQPFIPQPSTAQEPQDSSRSVKRKRQNSPKESSPQPSQAKKPISDAALKVNEIYNNFEQYGFDYYTGSSSQPAVQKSSLQSPLPSPQPLQASASQDVRLAKKSKKSAGPSNSVIGNPASVTAKIHAQPGKNNYVIPKKDPYRCTLCGETLKVNSTLHVLKRHSQQISVDHLIRCLTCGTSFKTEGAFQEHKKKTRSHSNFMYSLEACTLAYQYIKDNR